MSFKLLVTQGYSLGTDSYSSDAQVTVSLTTTVIDFDYRPEAETAFQILSAARQINAKTWRNVIRLYQTE